MALQALEREGSTGAHEECAELGDVDVVVVEFEFEWRRLCHACGERKRFRGLICTECRDRHEV